MPYNTKKINIAYKSKNNLTQKTQIILLMISDGQKWHYLLVKNLPGLLRGITCNHKEDFYCLNCFHSYRTENKLESHKKICENHDYCHVEMPTKDNNIIKDNATGIINYEKKKIIPLTKEEKINYNDQQICYICKKEFDTID